MCGIFARIANEPVAPALIEGLRRLEYRGYDSAGIATIEEGGIERRCAVGKVDALEAVVRSGPPAGTVGIAHTRWATHGSPSERNAHPHVAPGLAIAHNGIIENHRELRHALSDRGARFRSETDSEVIPWLMHQHMAAGASAKDAMHRVGEELHGAFAIAAISEREPDILRAYRRGSPLAVGFGKDGGVLASDPHALAGYAREAMILEDGDSAEITREGIALFNRAGERVQRQTLAVDPSIFAREDNPYAHHMLREIHEQPEVIARILSQYRVPADVLSMVPVDFRRVSRITLVACGTSYYAAALARRWFQEFARVPAEVAIASEFRYETFAPPLPGELAIVISQSGETADTIGAMEVMRTRGIPVIALVNQTGSTIAREADGTIPLLAGPEIGVASTKAFSAQLTVLALLALAAGQRRNQQGIAQFHARLQKLGDMVTAALHNEPAVIAVAERIHSAHSMIYVGRGPLFPVAMEGALKLKEISYIHAEGFAAGELKHGPIALVDPQTPIIALVASGPLFEKSASNIREIAARSGRIVLVGDRASLLSLSDVSTHSLTVPQGCDLLQPIVSTVPLQLLAYHVARLRGLDVDRPRNLAKSVTVE
ncbi:MAG: glutamine--fructose-6-phosphate transaminase (isomerizing) [Beijerinckiaceae bacterium]|nr:glutamine--fructose-6-phosphate transaminase (isomerizing) [Beijerinckiaceae bacterium]MCZ8300328.1 glutamine--fructose-6-phosphate transaminase (isomerizing) [Beijerinckiaceae bacterium]